MNELKELISIIMSSQDPALLENFLLGLTTEKERQEFAQRIEITKRLLAGEPQRQIASDLGVGIATVTRGSKELTAGKFEILRKRYEKN
jgi:TrpR family trp operon transcriptional repressor